MRKGATCRHWTTQEIAYLEENAGLIPKRDICKHLRRSSRSVARMAERLREKGVNIELRCYQSSLVTCPSCGALRGSIGKDGICEPCMRREQLAAIQSRISTLLPLLPQAERDTYHETEAELESYADPMPKDPKTLGMSRYWAAKLTETYELALEAWTVRNLRRQIKAAQKRKERIEKKAKIMGLSKNTR